MEEDKINIQLSDSQHFVHIDCDNHGKLREISDMFSYYAPNYQYMPAYKKGWDGKIRLYDSKNRILPTGLLIDLVEKYRDDIVFNDEKTARLVHNDMRFRPWVDFFRYLHHNVKLPEGIKAREYQLDTAAQKYSQKRGVIVSPTGSGKSLIIYFLLRLFIEEIMTYGRWKIEEPSPKILIIVPTISLVEQMFRDIRFYASEDPQYKDIYNYIARVHNQRDETVNESGKAIVISTWQSIHASKANLDHFKMVIGDECHRFKAKSLIEIMKRAFNADFRIGLTGTLSGSDEEMAIKACFGQIDKAMSTSELIKREFLARLKINVIKLIHSDIPDDIETHHDEIDYLFMHEKRNNFITNLALDLSGNTLILFKYVDKHGKVLYNLLKERNVDRSRIIEYVSGETDVESREHVRELVEENENAIVVASMGVFSTGVNIKELHNLILAAPTKSQITLLQSIGRALRKSGQQDTTVYDISDSFALPSSDKINYGSRHLKERIKIYKEEGFPFVVYPVKI